MLGGGVTQELHTDINESNLENPRSGLSFYGISTMVLA